MAAKKKAAAAKKTTAKGCNCADLIDDMLKPRNGVLVGTLRLNPAGPRRVYVAIEKLDTAERQKPPMLQANHCPFCGKKYPK